MTICNNNNKFRKFVLKKKIIINRRTYFSFAKNNEASYSYCLWKVCELPTGLNARSWLIRVTQNPNENRYLSQARLKNVFQLLALSFHWCEFSTFSPVRLIHLSIWVEYEWNRYWRNGKKRGTRRPRLMCKKCDKVENDIIITGITKWILYSTRYFFIIILTDKKRSRALPAVE